MSRSKENVIADQAAEFLTINFSYAVHNKFIIRESVNYFLW